MRNFVVGVIVGLVWAAFGNHVLDDVFEDIARHDGRLARLEKRPNHKHSIEGLTEFGREWTGLAVNAD